MHLFKISKCLSIEFNLMKKLVFLSAVLMVVTLMSSCTQTSTVSTNIDQSESYCGELDSYETKDIEYVDAYFKFFIYKTGEREMIDFYQRTNGSSKGIYLGNSSKAEIINLFKFLKNFAENEYLYDTIRFDSKLYYIEHTYNKNNKVTIREIIKDKNFNPHKECGKNLREKDTINDFIIDYIDIKRVYDWIEDFDADIINK